MNLYNRSIGQEMQKKILKEVQEACNIYEKVQNACGTEAPEEMEERQVHRQ